MVEIMGKQKLRKVSTRSRTFWTFESDLESLPDSARQKSKNAAQLPRHDGMPFFPDIEDPNLLCR
jgi:hypothetical protein